MGFIYDNTNTFQVYLTDLGKQAFFDEGLKDSILYFSISDRDANYNLFTTDPNLVLPFEVAIIYNVGDVVQYADDLYYILKMQYSGTTPIPTNQTYWDTITLYDPTILTPQPIPSINHVIGKKTSITNSINGVYVRDVFTQTPLRGAKADNIIYKRALLGTRNDTCKEYIMYEPDFNTNETLNIITYITR